MNNLTLRDYILDTLQEEECLLWDGILVDPEKLIDLELAVENWSEGLWVSQITTKLFEAYNKKG